MHPYIKETYDKLDLYNLSRTDCSEILRELFSFFYNENIYVDSSMSLKTPFLGGVFDSERYHSHYEGDIMLLKMYRKGLINMKLYECDLDVNTEIGKDYYRFLEKYSLSSVEYKSSTSGKIEYDLKGICDEEYEKFLFHICENIIIPKGEEEYFFDYCLDRIFYMAEITSAKEFFSGFSKMLGESVIESKTIRSDFIELLNKSGESFVIMYGDYIKGKSYYLKYFEFLESKGKVTLKSIKGVQVGEGQIRYSGIEFKFDKLLLEYNDVFLESLEYNIDNKISYKNNQIFIGKYEIPFNGEGKIKNLYMLLFDYYFQYKASFVSFFDLEEYYLENKNKYTFKDKPKFDYEYFRRDLAKKNESNSIYKNFLGINYSGISCQYLKEETFL